MHCASIPIKRGQLEFWARFIPLPPFWSSLIISDKIFGDCQLRSFTFEWYLGTSWTESTAAATKFTKSQLQFKQCAGRMWIKLWGRVEHSPQKSIKYFALWKKSRKIFVYFKFHFHNDAGPSEKSYFEVFSSAWCNLSVCQIWSFTDTSNSFFAIRCHIFGKYVMQIFFLQYLNSCPPARTGIIRFGSKLTKN